MGLKNFLLILTIILSTFTSLGILLGSSKKTRSETKFLFLSILFNSVWAISLLIFENLSPENGDLVSPLSFLIFLSPLAMDILILFFLLFERPVLQLILFAISALLLTFFGVLLANNPGPLYTDFSLTSSGNTINIANSFAHHIYTGFFVLYTILIIIAAIPHLKKFRTINVKEEIIIVGIGVFLLRIAMLICGFFSTIKTSEFLWLSPVMVALMVVLAYYAILKHQIIVLSSKWLKFVSYIVLITTAAAAYMLIFYSIITFLFKITNVSSEVFILNFIMVVILFIILPILNEVSQFIHSLIKKDKEYLAYLIKRMNKMYTRVDADKLANFIASNLHFSYIGIVVGGKVHGSKTEDFSEQEIALITALAEPEHGVWQKLDEDTKIMLKSHKIEAVAAMRDTRGGVFGQLIVGVPQGKSELEQSDLEQLESIVNLIAAMIDSRAE